MRINIHDKFKSWRHFIKFAKGLYRSLDKRGVEIKSICVYANIVDKESQKSTSLYLCDEDNQMLGEVGIDAGYFEWLNHEYDGMILQYKLEDELLNQAQYDYKRRQNEHKILDNKEEKVLKKIIFLLLVRLRAARKLKSLQQFLKFRREVIIGNRSRRLLIMARVIKIKYGKVKNFKKTLDKSGIICYNVLVK